MTTDSEKCTYNYSIGY